MSSISYRSLIHKFNWKSLQKLHIRSFQMINSDLKIHNVVESKKGVGFFVISSLTSCQCTVISLLFAQAAFKTTLREHKSYPQYSGKITEKLENAQREPVRGKDNQFHHWFPQLFQILTRSFQIAGKFHRKTFFFSFQAKCRCIKTQCNMLEIQGSILQ